MTITFRIFMVLILHLVPYKSIKKISFQSMTITFRIFMVLILHLVPYKSIKKISFQSYLLCIKSGAAVVIGFDKNRKISLINCSRNASVAKGHIGGQTNSNHIIV